jgi:hypothetical protein
VSKGLSGLDPSYWVNVRTPRVNKALTSHDIHQVDRRPPPGGKGWPQYRGAAACERRRVRREHRRARSGRSLREWLRVTASRAA